MTVDLFAGISVRDYGAALAWYGQLMGRGPSFHPNDVEAVWGVAEHAYLYVEHRPAHAGHGILTIFVEDLDVHLAGISKRGLQPTHRETYENGVRKVTYRDPDGNEISFGGGPARAPRP